VEELSKEFIEEKRPRIEIGRRTIDFTDTNWVLYVDFHNSGQADAEDVSFYVVLKYEHAPKDTLRYFSTRRGKITKGAKFNHVWFLPILKRVNLTCFIEVRYTWAIKNLPFETKEYYRFHYDKEQQRYGSHVLLEEQVKELWE
jgi:hypothetical protein